VLTLADLRERPSHAITATMECAGNGRALLAPHVVSQPWLVEAVGTARWKGVPLAQLLEEAEPLDDAVEVVFTGLDRGVEKEVEQNYERALNIDETGEALVAYEMSGKPLPPQHGFPLRLLVPGWYGMTNVKWLTRVAVTSEPFTGYQHECAYRLRVDDDDEGALLTRMLPRALMVPPGIPDFNTRERKVPLGPVALEGRAWSGHGRVSSVEISDDDGATWVDASLEESESPWAWGRWTYRWEPGSAGRHVLCCRASDESGRSQPLEPEWNLGGYANNAVQRVVVDVVAGYDEHAPE
jgi:DMSO/TMAO reductase YedYZ molybdopterin-dependent catalytic subunit